jgi:hypothetical protein
VGCFLIACGDGGGGDDPQDEVDCGIDLAVSGGVEAEVKAVTGASACAGQIGSPSAAKIEVYFLPLKGPRIDLRIHGVMPGQTGTFATDVVIDPAGTKHRTTACNTNLVEHAEAGPGAGELDDTAYRVRGSVTCGAPATSSTAEPATIEHLEFVIKVSWFNS